MFYCGTELHVWLPDSFLRMVMWSTLHPGLHLPSPSWCWCWHSPGSGCSSSTSAASELLQQHFKTNPSFSLWPSRIWWGSIDYFANVNVYIQVIGCLCLTAVKVLFVDSIKTTFTINTMEEKCTVVLQPAQDVGLWGGPVREGASSI